MEDVLGIDLNVLPHFKAHDGSRVDLVMRERTQPATGNTGHTLLTDLDRLKGRENLAQALILRLLTPLGSLKGLGHANYGSRLHELIGRH